MRERLGQWIYGISHYAGIGDEYMDCRFKLKATFYRADNREVDCDNLLKTLMDAATYAGVWRNDSQVDEVEIKKVLGDPNPRIEASFFYVLG